MEALLADEELMQNVTGRVQVRASVRVRAAAGAEAACERTADADR